MDEEETKVCPNCKREIPGINFTTHTVHCARNLRVCRVCKEPVPVADLQKHHDELHKQLPCKQCGESVCGTDLEDHIRDSCANTVKSCRFCSLELPRRELPAHEGYCGVRTEQCADCREWVMIKYRQLHLDSNHGFIRLHDDPAPIPKKDPYKSNLNRPTAPKNVPSTSNGFVPSSIFENFTKSKGERTDRLGNNNDGSSSSGGSSLSESIGRSGGSGGSGGSDSGGSSSSGLGRKTQNTNGAQPPVKRTNDQPQININSASASKVDKDLGVSRGAVKKRVAPKPPSREPEPEPVRDLPYYSALERKQREEKERAEQNAYNLSVGLPPVLSPAAKVEKLRKMDALQNRDVSDNDYKNRLRRNIWSEPSWNTGHMVGTGSLADPGPSNPRPNERQNPRPNAVLPDAAGPSNLRSNGEPSNNPRPNLFGPLDSGPSVSVNNPRPKLNINGPVKNQSPNDVDMKLEELRNLKPMTPMEFMERFNELQLRPQGGERVERGDRFSEIKSSLRELRRGLNEVTAPYNSNAAANNINNGRGGRSGPRSGSASPAEHDAEHDAEVRLPCEFCDVPIPMDDLVQHQTGCRPDLAQFRVGAGGPAQAAAQAQAVDNARYRANLNHNQAEQAEDPVIPCEFCARSLPVYLISEHQERCGRESNLLFAD